MVCHLRSKTNTKHPSPESRKPKVGNRTTENRSWEKGGTLNGWNEEKRKAATCRKWYAGNTNLIK